MNIKDFFEEHRGVIVFITGIALIIAMIVFAVTTMGIPAAIINNAGVRVTDAPVLLP